MIKCTEKQCNKTKYIIIILIPVVLSAFTHLWNPTGFPSIYIDEDHYMRRALQVLEGQGPQESILVYDHPYDHPYFGQIFLASLLKITDYRYHGDQNAESPQSIEQLYLTPRIIMGLLAVVDTLLVYKIGEIWKGKKVGFVSAILFGVMPLTWMLKMILLDNLLMPFFLSSVLIALFVGKRFKKDSSVTALIFLSGITLGLAIFTKIPVVTFIPLVGYIIYKETKSFRKIGLWSIPVILIPLIWPGYIIYSGNLENGLNGILYQIERGERDFADTLNFIVFADPVLVILGIVGGLTLTFVKRDLLFVLWTIPYFLFIWQVGGIVKYFHFIELLPILAISGGFIIVTISNKISAMGKKSARKIKIHNFLSIILIAGIGIFGLTCTLMVIGNNTNETFFELSAFISNYVVSNTDLNMKTTLMGQHWIRSFSWIPMYIHDKTNFVKDVFPERYLREPLKTDDVLMVVDNQLKHDVLDYSVQGEHLDKIRKIYHDSDRVGLFVDNPIKNIDINQYPFTNMKEVLELGLIEVRSNHVNEDNIVYAQTSNGTMDSENLNLTVPQIPMPTVADPNLKVELVASGLKYPTTMAFVGKDDILVLEKNNGTIMRIINGTLLDKPVIDFNVANKIERGLLGIAVANQTLNNSTGEKTYVYVFYTQALKDGNDVCSGATVCDEKTNPLGNRVYRLEWTGSELINPNLILDLPVGPGADHNGGVIKVGPDGNIYVLVGDGDSCWEDEFCTGTFEDSTVNAESSNVPTGHPPDGRGGILRINPFGEPILGGENKTTGVLAEHSPLNKYFAYGVRNGFGLAFDPISNKLWDSENGPGYGDELNLVEPGFNSGWLKVQGWWPVENAQPLPPERGYFGDKIVTIPDNLETFADKGHYSSPEFTWNMSVGVTALEFIKNDTLGTQYQNDLFVADYNNNYLYDFNLIDDRTKLDLEGDLVDKVANNNAELDSVVFGEGFGVATDIKEGPDGYLYVLSHLYGNLYRIVPK